MASENFVLQKVEKLLAQYAKAHGPIRPPIDPAKVASFCSVKSIERRAMVPEGVLTPVAGGFKIYLQNNFVNQRNISARERFTVAHELIHTFFYDLAQSVPKPIKGSPTGQRLERLCHIGASQILVPEPLLRHTMKEGGEMASAESILMLARLFGVSTEVLMRQLQKLGLIEDERFAAILVDCSDGGSRLIKAACYGSLLTCNANRPTRGMNFDTWVRSLMGPTASPEDSGWTYRAKTSIIVAKKVRRSNRSFILDIKFQPLGTDQHGVHPKLFS